MFLHMKLLANGWMLLRMARRIQITTRNGASALAKDECHMKQMKSVLEYMHSISCTAIATEVGISPASVYHILPTAWGNKGFCKVESIHVQQWPKNHMCCSCYHSSAAMEKWRQCIHLSHFNGWRVMDAFVWRSAEMTECWMSCPNVTEEENCTPQQGALRVMHVMFFIRNGLDHPVPIGTIDSDQYYCALLQDKVRLALCL